MFGRVPVEKEKLDLLHSMVAFYFFSVLSIFLREGSLVDQNKLKQSLQRRQQVVKDMSVSIIHLPAGGDFFYPSLQLN